MCPDYHATTRFFSNRGAVAGVFLLVGLAITSFFLWLAFWYRRRRRRLQLQRDADVAAGYGYGKSPRAHMHDDGDDPPLPPRRTFSSDMQQRPDSLLYTNRAADYGNLPLDSPGSDPFASNPYFSQPAPDHNVPVRPTQPPLDTTASLLAAAGLGGGAAALGAAAASGSGNSADASGSGTSSSGHGHQQRPSSSEPLLVTVNGSKELQPRTGEPPTPPPRSPLRQQRSQYAAVSQQPSEASLLDEDKLRSDDRLNPHLTARLRRTDTDTRSMRDNVDYSRPVLGVSSQKTLLDVYGNFLILTSYTRCVQVRNISDDASISVYSRDED
jgi:hypothetical protein